MARFYWLGIRAEMCRWCASCPECQLVNPPAVPRAPLRPLPLVEAPFDRIGMDIIDVHANKLDISSLSFSTTNKLSGGVDSFDFSSKNVGDIASICLGHMPKDGKKVKGEVFWHVEEVIVTEKELGNRYFFACNAQIPLSAKRDEFMTFECTRTVESFASKASSLVPVKYEIIVITADQKGAGTDANVFITLYGTNGDSGRRQLRQKFRNLFEREQADRFVLEMLDMGELLRVKMEHDNTGLSPGWLLDRVEVTNTANGVTTVFMCGKWLDTKKADGQIFRIIYPKY